MVDELAAEGAIALLLRTASDCSAERGEIPEMGVLFESESQLLDNATERIEELHPYAALTITRQHAVS